MAIRPKIALLTSLWKASVRIFNFWHSNAGRFLGRDNNGVQGLSLREVGRTQKTKE